MSKFRITPIGTCRIHTPLRRAVPRYPIEMDLRRNYGFVHSSQEALQLIRFLQGEQTFPSEVAQILARDGNLNVYPGTKWERADLHLVELSSSKLISSQGVAVQINYIARHFADFFASTERSRAFWSAVKARKRHDLLDLVRHDASYRRMSRADRELLLSLSIAQQSYRALQTDMAEIVERLGRDRVVFVTHVNAVAADEHVIAARDRLIRIVHSAAEQLEVPVYDPSDLMRQFGQDRALENGGLDLTHFTPAFSDAVFDELHQLNIAPRMAAAGEDSGLAEVEPGSVLAAKLTRMLEFEDLKTVGRKIFAAVRECPNSPSLIALRGFVRSRIGDFESALEDLRAGGDEAGLPEEMRIALVDALYHTGDPEGALQIANSLISDEFESPAIYSMAAQAAEALGRTDDALFYSKQAFRRDRGNLGAALRALKVATKQGDPEQVADWRREILENLAEATNGALEVCMWAVDNRDDAMFTAAIGAVGSYDKAGTIDLFEKAAEASMSRAVADGLVVMANLGRMEPALAHRRADLFQWVLDEAGHMLEVDRPVEAYHLALGFANLEGIPSSQLRIDRLVALAARHKRIVERHLRTSVRNAFTEGDLDAVITLGEGAQQVIPNDGDTAVIVARALHAADRNAEAIDLLVGAQRANPVHWGVRRWLARLASMEPNYALAIPHYGAIQRSSDPAAGAFHSEAARFLERAGRRALRQMRDLWREGRYEDSIVLAEAMRDEGLMAEEIEREFGRMHRLLRIRLREIEQEETDLEEREPILHLMDRIKPDDEAVLRRLALEFMRQFRFGEAAEYWERLDLIKPNNETVLRNRQKCRILAERRAKSSITEVAA